MILLFLLLSLRFSAAAVPTDPCEAGYRALATGESPLVKYSRDHFDLFVIAQGAQTNSKWWEQAVEALTRKDGSTLSSLFENAPPDERARAARLLASAEDSKIELPPQLRSQAAAARKARDELRSKDLRSAIALSKGEERDLANLFTLLGIRRSRMNRLYQRAKGRLGGTSEENIPIILADKTKNALGDEARLLFERFNREATRQGADAKQAYRDLVNGLYDLYTTRIYEVIDDPAYAINGVQQNMIDFVNADAYHQPNLKPSNRWMTVGRLDPETVQNPQMKGVLTREMWWNRDKGLHPIGTTRIARNMKVLPDGKEQVMTVEVLIRDKNKNFAPYLFEPDASGKLQLVRTPDARRKMLSCFGCHFRLSGIFFGGISMKNYSPSPQWFINNIDRVQYRYHKKFEGLLR